MHKLFTDGRRNTIHSHNLLPLLGLRAGQHLPKEGLAPQLVQGIKVWIAPVDPASTQRRPHRVRAECSECKADVPAGRLFQHKCS